VSDEELGAALEAELAALGSAVTVDDLQRLSGGASRETWSFTAVVDGHRRPLILQRQRAGGIRTGVAMEGEAHLVRAAGRAGVPVPAVVAAATEQRALGRSWVVTERVDGESIPRRVLRSLTAPTARRLTEQCGHALAATHRIDPTDIAGLHRLDQVQQFREIVDGYDEPSPAFEIGLRWLEEHRPDPEAEVVVHGDFRLGNLLVDDHGLAAVIDWELAHLGDPIEDLGWLCVRAWRFGAEPPVGGFGRREDLYEAYEAASGHPVDPERAHWWEVMGTLKWGVMCIIQARTHLDGLTRSVELATIGRRVCENEHDLLALIAPEQPDPQASAVPAAGGSPAPGLHGRPTAAELVEAVREHLAGAVMESVEGRTGFHTRVAANALAMVERELELGPAMAEAHRARLATLDVADDRALAAAIRDGSTDHRSAEVLSVVRSSIADKLAVAHPGYAEDPPR
jgi:aminoglycoside phosphotransferase (APT) family kinase protein